MIVISKVIKWLTWTEVVNAWVGMDKIPSSEGMGFDGN
jgi:hypothetical protein